MNRKPVLVEITAGGRGIALGPGGRFHHVRVPAGIGLGEELSARSGISRSRPALAAAVACLFIGCSLAVILPRRSVEAYSLVNLRFAKPGVSNTSTATTALPDVVLALEQDKIQMTLAIDRRGTVAAVRPRARNTENLVGMRVEQAIQHTVGRLSEITDGGVEVRPFPSSSDDETEALTERIRTALPDHQPPIGVEVGPPTEGGELGLAPEANGPSATGEAGANKKDKNSKKSFFQFLKKKNQTTGDTGN